MRGVTGSLHRLAEAISEYAGYALAVLAAGYSLAFFVWGWAHREILPGFIFANELAPDARARLLVALLASATLALALWLGLGLLVGHKRPAAIGFLKQSAAWALGLTLLAFLPVLAIPSLPSGHPWSALGLAAAAALLAFGSAGLVLRLRRAAAVPVASRPSPTDVTAGLAQPAVPMSRSRAPLVVVACLALAYIGFMSVYTIARHNAFMTHSFDLGIHDQILYNLVRQGYLRSTQHGTEAINYLGEHFSPILYLIAPFYAIRPEAGTLLVLQSLLLGLGALPVYLLARRQTRSEALAVVFAASYLLFPALQGVNTFDFHQIVPVTVLLLGSLYFLETDRTLAFLVTLGLALLTKEEVALTGAAIGVYIFLAKRRYGLGFAVAALSLAYFLIVVGWAMPALGGKAQINRFEGMMAPGSAGFAGILQTLLSNPWYVAGSILGNRDKMLYLSQLLLPVAGLPLLGGAGWLVALPSLAAALLSSAETQYTVGYHYAAGSIPGIFFLAILGGRRLDPGRYPRPALAAAVLLASLAMNYEFGWLLGRNFQGMPQPSQRQAAVAACLEEIPATASLSTMSDLVPHVSHRANIYLFPVVNGADYIFFDTDPKANFWPFIGRDGRSQAQSAAAEYLVSGEYGVVEAHDTCLLLQRGAATARNHEGLRLLLAAQVEAEDQPGDFGVHNLRDTAASEGRARVGAPGLAHERGKNALTSGPYDTLWPGKYRVTFWLKLAGAPPASSGRLATLDVYSGTAGGELAGTDVAATDLRTDGSYGPVVVDLETQRIWHDVEYRVLYAGKGQLWVDYVEVMPLEVRVPQVGQVVEFK